MVFGMAVPTCSGEMGREAKQGQMAEWMTTPARISHILVHSFGNGSYYYFFLITMIELDPTYFKRLTGGGVSSLSEGYTC